MAKTDWKMKDKVKPSDMNAIGEEINELHNGFIKKSIVIPTGSDLNTYMEEGNYYCPANATVETLLNSPTGEAFHLTVEPHAGVLQTLTTFQPGNLEVFQRNYYFGWGAWKKVPTRDELEEILPQADENAQNYVDAKTWQKFPLTQDDGRVKALATGFNLNNLLTAGQYNCSGPLNGPAGTTDATWLYIEVMVHSSGDSFVMQRVTQLNNLGVPIIFARIRTSSAWQPWDQVATNSTKVWGAL